MAIISDIPKQTHWLKRITQLIETLIENYSKARDISKTVTELNKLSDRDLADLGMNRSEILSRAKNAYNKI
jgi:uncharacterized protein YjiS (DUF1127 family)